MERTITGTSDLSTSIGEGAFIAKYRFKAIHDVGVGGLGPMFVAALEGNSTMVETLSAAAVDVNQGLTVAAPHLHFVKGMTPLMASSYVGRVEATGALLRARANTEQPNMVGDFPLFTAAASPTIARFDVIRLLLAYKANALNELPGKGQNVLHAAASCTTRNLCQAFNKATRLLLDARASVNHATFLGVTPLVTVAVFQGSREFSTYLIDNRADVSLTMVPRGVKGKVFFQVVQWQLWFGAKSEVCRLFSEFEGGGCLHVAAAQGMKEHCHLFIQAKADPSIRNRAGHTAADIAKNIGLNHDFCSMLKPSTFGARIGVVHDGTTHI